MNRSVQTLIIINQGNFTAALAVIGHYRFSGISRGEDFLWQARLSLFFINKSVQHAAGCGCASAILFPLRVEGAFLIHAAVGVRPKIITLRLGQVGGQAFAAVGVKIG